MRICRARTPRPSASPTRATSATRSGPSSRPTWRWCAETRRSDATTCARSSTPPAGWRIPARPGAGCRTTCRPGTASMRRRAAGWRRASSRPSSPTCGCSCAWSPGATASPARRSWTVARCSRRPRAARRGAPAIPLNDHHPLGPLALFGQTDFLAAFLGGGKGTAKKGARPIQLALLVEGGQSGTPDALPDSSFVPALESSPHRRGRAILAG